MKLVVLSILSVVAAVLVLTASASEKATSSCDQGKSLGKSIGAGNVLHGHVYLGRAEKYGDGNRLFSGNVICTGENGLFKIQRDAPSKGISCKVKADSSVELGPLGNALLNYRSGTSRCQINGGGMTWLKTPTAMIHTRTRRSQLRRGATGRRSASGEGAFGSSEDPTQIGGRRTQSTDRRASGSRANGADVDPGAIESGATGLRSTRRTAPARQRHDTCNSGRSGYERQARRQRRQLEEARCRSESRDGRAGRTYRTAGRAGIARVGRSARPRGPQGPPGAQGTVGPPGPSSALAFASRDVAGSPEALPSSASNAGVLNLDIASGTSGYVCFERPRHRDGCEPPRRRRRTPR